MIPTEESSPKTKVPQVVSSVNKMHKLITDTENSVESLRKVKPCPVCHGDGFYSFPEAASVDLSDGYYECDRCDGKGFI
jgi:DnaJ-class molecular chaperone